MEYILAVNSRRHKAKGGQNAVKRSNVTAGTGVTNTTGNSTSNRTRNDTSITDVIQKINEDEKTADDLLEGDILVSKLEENDKKLIKLKEENKEGLVEEPELLKPRALRDQKRLWLNRQIPYVIDQSLYYEQNIILQTIKDFNTKSCLQFVPRQGNERDYAVFERRDGCYSNIGRAYSQPGPQTISIGQGCDKKSIITHEMLHAAGFYHEQSRSDRGQYLAIFWDNILPGFKDQFMEYGHGETDNFNIVYNYKSIMQYGRTAFSAGQGDTMAAIGNPKLDLGGEEMTAENIMMLDLLYDCKSKTFNAWTQWSSFGPCNSQCYKRRQRYCYGNSPSACGEANAYGIDEHWEKCLATECPVRVNGNWGRWSPWGACTTQCDEGVQTRTRSCDDPKPANNGAQCADSNSDYAICVNPRCNVDKYHDDFRSGQIGDLWLNSDTDTPGLDWLVGKGSTPTEGTGPVSDPLGNVDGYYLYVESSDRSRSDEATLISKPLKGTNKTMKCLRFNYHMFGETTGYLYVARTDVDQDKESYSPLLFKTGAQGDLWNSASVTYDSTSDYRIEFRAVLGGATYSDIAIDNLLLDDRECECQDQYNSCSKWAEKGDCKNSVEFMNQNCKKSCKIPCGCRDKEARCPKWGKIGECKKNQEYMNTACPVTCGVCGCRDKEARCPKWGKTGECKKNKGYMNAACPLTCGVCACHDDNLKCPELARHNACKKKRHYMAIHCRQSCGWC